MRSRAARQTPYTSRRLTRLLLASASPRRAQILRQLGLDFQVQAADVDETMLPGESGEAAALRLARAKAEAVAAGSERPVLAADTLVLCDGAVLGKPRDAQDAARMLAGLAGRRHDVVTGVCLLAGQRAAAGLERTSVSFAPLSSAQIEWYVATGEPLDKAGAYHVDGLAALFIHGVDGSPSNVAGLPVGLLYRLAAELQVDLGWPAPERR